jgi:glycosyltransferase involved in cell wall biosynthesis
MNLSVVIIARNEEENLPRCLKSVSFADEIILVDSQSTDRTVEIAESFGARVSQVEWKGYGPAKQSALNRACGKWVFSIDADEEVTPRLREEIKQIIAADGPHDGYSVNRMTNFLGRWIRHSGWYPDRVLRLFKRANGKFSSDIIHEEALVEGSIGQLKNDLLHYSYPDLESYLERSNRYTTIGAEAAYKIGKRYHFFSLLIKPLAAFSKCYLTGLGFLDGVEGFMIATLSAKAAFVKYCKLRTLQKMEKTN